MIADLKPNAEYRDSGLPWLGRLPVHWRSEHAKWLFVKMSRPVRPEDEVVTCFRDGTVTLRKNRRLRGYTEATVEHGYQGIRKGDLVIHGMDAFAGAIGVADSDGKGTPVYNVCRPREGVNADYYAQLVRYMSQSNWILALARGIRERSTDFRYETFADQRLPLPPPEEQVASARFLDWANGRLERAIRAKRRVIALLNEQKQAILESIDMDSYRVEKRAVASLMLADQEAEIEPLPIQGGGKKQEPDLDPLSEILKRFNEQFGTTFSDADRILRHIRDDIAPKVAADPAFRNALENTPHTARLAHDQALAKAAQGSIKDYTQFYKQFVENDDFKRFVGDMVFRLASIRPPSQPPAA